MFASVKTYAALAAIASSTNYASLVSAQVNNAGTVAEGQPCQAGEAMLLACADTSSLLVCNHNTWNFFSACPQGTVCSNDMCVNDDSVAVSPATSASVTAPATTGAPSATTGIAHENDNDNDEDDGGDGDDGDDGDNDNTAISSGSDTNVSSPTAAGPADNTDSTSISVNEPPSDTNVASELGPESNNSSIVDNSDASDLSDSGSDIVNNIGTLSEFSELDTEVSSDDDWFESLKSSASTLPVGTQRICLTVLSTLAFSAAFTWIL